MIEQSTTLQWLIMIPAGFMLFSVLIFGFKYEKDSIVITSVIICIVIIGVMLYYVSIDNQKYSDAVNAEIETASCNDLIKMYNDYALFKEEIKSKYIFKCVADKESLELLQ